MEKIQLFQLEKDQLGQVPSWKSGHHSSESHVQSEGAGKLSKWSHVTAMGSKLWPIGSMYGIFTYIYHTNQPNVGRYNIHGSHELCQRGYYTPGNLR